MMFVSTLRINTTYVSPSVTGFGQLTSEHLRTQGTIYCVLCLFSDYLWNISRVPTISVACFTVPWGWKLSVKCSLWLV